MNEATLHELIALAAHGTAEKPIGSHEWTCAVTLMAEALQTPEPNQIWAMGRDDRSPAGLNRVIAYMDATDWRYELGSAAGGNRVYPSVEDLRRDNKCHDECGIVEVEVRFRKTVQEPKI